MQECSALQATDGFESERERERNAKYSYFSRVATVIENACLPPKVRLKSATLSSYPGYD